MANWRVLLLCLGIGLLADGSAAAEPSLLPRPRKIDLTGNFTFVTPRWSIALDPSVQAEDAAVETLIDEFDERDRVRLAVNGAAGPKIKLKITPGVVAVGAAIDRDRAALARQAYQLDIAVDEIDVIANAPAGLLYGVATLVQLAEADTRGARVPLGHITDWPDTQLRAIYWDDAHHLEKLPSLKDIIRKAAFFKINAVTIKLEGHFQFQSAPAVVEPYALSAAELTELTHFALHRHVQLIPYLDAPAHVAFILKHPEYASLRLFSDCNYELCTTDPRATKLIADMCRDLIAATPGSDYVFLSTDEPYYVGKAAQGNCEGGGQNAGKLLGQFVTDLESRLHDQGRTVLFWGEAPLTPEDVPSLPSRIINGETDAGPFDAACRAHGMRQTVYTSIEGEEKLFPNYFIAPSKTPQSADEKPRVADALGTIQAAVASGKPDLMGVIVAGWGDMGLHPDTFWLGYACAASGGWNLAGADPAASQRDFLRLYFGPSAIKLDRVVELLSTQAQFWSQSWDEAPSAARVGIWGNSNAVYRPRHPAHDQTLKLPPAPAPGDLSSRSTWSADNSARLKSARQSLMENDELLNLLETNLRQAEFQHESLEVFRSVADLCRQNLLMLDAMEKMDGDLADAERLARANDAAGAVAAIDRLIDRAQVVHQRRNEALSRVSAVWNRSWQPRVASANGRTFLHEVDDVKDHLPDRTLRLDYLVYRELLLPMGTWMTQVIDARNTYAAARGLPKRAMDFAWDVTRVER